MEEISKYLLGSGMLALILKDQIASFFRGIIVSVKNNTKKGNYYIMRNRNTDNTFLVKILKESWFKHAGCHVLHVFSGRFENIAWSFYSNYTFMPVTEEELTSIESGKKFELINEKVVLSEQQQ